MEINLKHYLQIQISHYNDLINEQKIDLKMAENITNEEDEISKLSELREAIQYNQCMIYAKEALLSEI